MTRRTAAASAALVAFVLTAPLLLCSALHVTSSETGAEVARQLAADAELSARAARAEYEAHGARQLPHGRRLSQTINAENVTVARTNTSAVGTNFDVQWEIGWPGLNPSCNGFVLYTMTNFNDLPMERGAIGPYAMVMPNGMRYNPYFSWSHIVAPVPNGIFVNGMVLRMAFLGFYMGPGFNSTMGVGLSCDGRCPCQRLPEPPVYIGPGGALPPPDTGADASNPVPVPADIRVELARNNPSKDPGFDFSWMLNNETCDGQIIFDVTNLEDFAIDSSLKATWTVCLPPTMYWSDPTSWGFNSSDAIANATGCAGITNIGYYMSAAGQPGATAFGAFALTLRCFNFESGPDEQRMCQCPDLTGISIAAGAVQSASPAPTSYKFEGPLYPTATTTGLLAGITWSGNAIMSACPGSLCFGPTFIPFTYMLQGTSSLELGLPVGATALKLWFTSAASSTADLVAAQSRAWQAVAATTGGDVTVRGPQAQAPPGYYGFELSLYATGGATMSKVTITWESGSPGFRFSYIYVSGTPVF